jgi:glutamate-1-semialdehyde 2,1-aminomutase
MPDSLLTNSKVVAAYRERTQKSAELAATARQTFPSGITHDSRHTDPYGIYVDHAKGSRKWDVDGNEYVDYFGGHGALILGHNYPGIIEATHAQLDKGTHFGAGHPAEVEWGGLVRQMVPCAERVRFTSSGTEANLMAFRLARAFTKKPKLVRFICHFHGWQDHVAFGAKGGVTDGPVPGVLDGIIENVILIEPGNEQLIRETLSSRDDIAGVILEPTGASFGGVPVTRDFVAALRDATTENGVLLMFDEVVTGFRVSPGGAQAYYGITPDLTSLAKILSGGLPGGAVCGRADILELLDFEVAEEKGFEKIGHQGTYNANPMSAVAGIAALTEIRDSDACERASANGAKIRARINDVFTEENIPWAAFGDHSAWFVYTNPEGRDIDPKNFDGYAQSFEHMRDSGNHPATGKLRIAMLVNGVDITSKPGGTVMAAHTDEDIERTAEAMRQSVRMLRDEGDL